MSEILKSKQLKIPKWKTTQMSSTEERMSTRAVFKWWHITERGGCTGCCRPEITVTHRRDVEQRQPDSLVIVVQVVCGTALEVRREGHLGARGVGGAGSAVP